MYTHAHAHVQAIHRAISKPEVLLCQPIPRFSAAQKRKSFGTVHRSLGDVGSLPSNAVALQRGTAEKTASSARKKIKCNSLEWKPARLVVSFQTWSNRWALWWLRKEKKRKKPRNTHLCVLRWTQLGTLRTCCDMLSKAWTNSNSGNLKLKEKINPTKQKTVDPNKFFRAMMTKMCYKNRTIPYPLLFFFFRYTTYKFVSH